MERLIENNISNSVSFVLNAAKKRRTSALSKAKMVQCELGMTPLLSAVK